MRRDPSEGKIVLQAISGCVKDRQCATRSKRREHYLNNPIISLAPLMSALERRTHGFSYQEELEFVWL